MGGGSSSEQASTQTTQNWDEDVVVDGGSIGVGKNGEYIAQGVDAGALGVMAQNSTTAIDVTSGVKIGDNTTVHLTAMEDNTRAVLDQALTIVSANANNMMTLAAGRDPNTPLADESNEIKTEGDSVAKVVESSSPVAAALFVAGLVGGGFLLLKKGSK